MGGYALAGCNPKSAALLKLTYFQQPYRWLPFSKFSLLFDFFQFAGREASHALHCCTAFLLPFLARHFVSFVSSRLGWARKLRFPGLRETEVKTMFDLITRYELRLLNVPELFVLHRELSELLAQSDGNTSFRRDCLASLENTISEINSRLSFQWKLGFHP